MDTNKLEENINFNNVGPIWGENYQYRSRFAIRNFLNNNMSKEYSKKELLLAVASASGGLFSPVIIEEEVIKFKKES